MKTSKLLTCQTGNQKFDRQLFMLRGHINFKNKFPATVEKVESIGILGGRRVDLKGRALY